jgi:hypothetical protein
LAIGLPLARSICLPAPQLRLGNARVSATTFRRNAQSNPLPPPAAEFEVHAGADDVLVERDRRVGAAAIGEAAGRVAKIDEQIFGLSALVPCKGVLETDAGGPAHLRGAHERKRAGGSLDICKRSTGGAV